MQGRYTPLLPHYSPYIAKTIPQRKTIAYPIALRNAIAYNWYIAFPTTRYEVEIPMSRPTVQQFIETWEKSACVSEVADKTKLRKSTVQAKATQLRKLGIPLKKFKGSRHRIDIEAALEVLAKIRGTSVTALKKEAAKEPPRRVKRTRSGRA